MKMSDHFTVRSSPHRPQHRSEHPLALVLAALLLFCLGACVGGRTTGADEPADEDCVVGTLGCLCLANSTCSFPRLVCVNGTCTIGEDANNTAPPNNDLNNTPNNAPNNAPNNMADASDGEDEPMEQVEDVQDNLDVTLADLGGGPEEDVAPPEDVEEPECTENAQCDDENPCTDDVCQQGSCASIDNDAACDDGIFCNGPDTCVAGSCDGHEGDPCAGEGVCDEEADQCQGCLEDADCPGPDPGGYGECGEFDSECDSQGLQFRTETHYSCVDNVCEASTSEISRQCSREVEGEPCGMAPGLTCQQGLCVGGEQGITITASTRGNATLEARLRLTCEQTGAECLIEGNRPAGETNCSITCPENGRVAICCSNGSEPCGGEFAPANDGRELEDLTLEGFTTDDCPPTPTNNAIECTADLSNLPATIHCDFTD